MKTKITSRDVKFFFIGLFAFFLLQIILDWEENVKSFKEGWRGEIESSRDH